MSIVPIWVSGPDPEAAARRLARQLGYRDPVVARRVLVQGSRSNSVCIIVAEGPEEAEANRVAGRRRKA